jgi:hypothetical protein
MTMGWWPVTFGATEKGHEHRLGFVGEIQANYACGRTSARGGAYGIAGHALDIREPRVQRFGKADRSLISYRRCLGDLAGRREAEPHVTLLSVGRQFGDRQSRTWSGATRTRPVGSRDPDERFEDVDLRDRSCSFKRVSRLRTRAALGGAAPRRTVRWKSS